MDDFLAWVEDAPDAALLRAVCRAAGARVRTLGYTPDGRRLRGARWSDALDAALAGFAAALIAARMENARRRAIEVEQP